MLNVNIVSRFETRVSWKAEDIGDAIMYVPSFFQGKDQDPEYPMPDPGSMYKFESWIIVFNKMTAKLDYTHEEIKFLSALWGYLSPKGSPLRSGWTSDLKWEYVNFGEPIECQPGTFHQVQYTVEQLAVYGYVTWVLSLRFAERSSTIPLDQHAVFRTVTRFFPCIQNEDLLVQMVDYTSQKLRGYFRSGTPVCSSVSAAAYAPSILLEHTTTHKAYQVAKNRDIPDIETGFYGLVTIGIFMSGFAAYETVVEGLRKHRKAVQDIVPFFPFQPFSDYFNKVAEVDQRLAKDPWYGLCQKLYENADTPVSANKFPVPSYVGMCFQIIEAESEVPPSMPGVSILDSVRERFAAYVYKIIQFWEQPPVLSGTRQILVRQTDKTLATRDFKVTEEDITGYVRKGLPDLPSQRGNLAHQPTQPADEETSTSQDNAEDDLYPQI